MLALWCCECQLYGRHLTISRSDPPAGCRSSPNIELRSSNVEPLNASTRLLRRKDRPSDERLRMVGRDAQPGQSPCEHAEDSESDDSPMRSVVPSRLSVYPPLSRLIYCRSPSRDKKLSPTRAHHRSFGRGHDSSGSRMCGFDRTNVAKRPTPAKQLASNRHSGNSNLADWNTSKRPLATSPNRPSRDAGTCRCDAAWHGRSTAASTCSVT